MHLDFLPIRAHADGTAKCVHTIGELSLSGYKIGCLFLAHACCLLQVTLIGGNGSRKIFYLRSAYFDVAGEFGDGCCQFLDRSLGCFDFKLCVLGHIVAPFEILLVRLGFCLTVCLHFGCALVHEIQHLGKRICVRGANGHSGKNRGHDPHGLHCSEGL